MGCNAVQEVNVMDPSTVLYHHEDLPSDLWRLPHSKSRLGSRIDENDSEGTNVNIATVANLRNLQMRHSKARSAKSWLAGENWPSSPFPGDNAPSYDHKVG